MLPAALKTPEEALVALGLDKLGTVYYKADGVFVATRHGSGQFSKAEWEKAKGFKNSLEKKA